MPESLLAEFVLESAEEHEDLDAEKPTRVVPVQHSVEKREDPDATVRLPKLPQVIPVTHSVEKQKDLDIKMPPKAPAGLKEVESSIPLNIFIPICVLCGKMKERNICLYTMWKGMNNRNGTSNHTSGLASVSG